MWWTLRIHFNIESTVISGDKCPYVSRAHRIYGRFEKQIYRNDRFRIGGTQIMSPEKSDENRERERESEWGSIQSKIIHFHETHSKIFSLFKLWECSSTIRGTKSQAEKKMRNTKGPKLIKMGQTFIGPSWLRQFMQFIRHSFRLWFFGWTPNSEHWTVNTRWTKVTQVPFKLITFDDLCVRFFFSFWFSFFSFFWFLSFAFQIRWKCSTEKSMQNKTQKTKATPVMLRGDRG